MFRPREVGPRAFAAEAPWRLGPVADVPDTVLEAGRVGGLEVRAASTRGSAHRCDGEVRQDAVGVTALDDRYVLAAVADGVGTAADAHHGATLAVRHALGYLAWALSGSSLDQVDVGVALDAADRAVYQAGPDPGHRSTTLTVAVMDVDTGWTDAGWTDTGWTDAGDTDTGDTDTVRAAGRGHAFRVARVGDSPAFRLAGGEFRTLFENPGDPAPVFDPATDSLPTPAGPTTRVSGVLAPGEALVLATDGVGVPVRETGAGAYLAEAWAEPPGPVAYLHQLQFNLKSFDDDRTAVVIWAGHVG